MSRMNLLEFKKCIDNCVEHAGDKAEYGDVSFILTEKGTDKYIDTFQLRSIGQSGILFHVDIYLD